mmetsp:Transcript_94008/g.263125  ORF Transcript_94008/g.263125 Transcript_94008/m.263125 type:complete len:534 (+) Transcript_94008:46-1647(+)
MMRFALFATALLLVVGTNCASFDEEDDSTCDEDAVFLQVPQAIPRAVARQRVTSVADDIVPEAPQQELAQDAVRQAEPSLLGQQGVAPPAEQQQEQVEQLMEVSPDQPLSQTQENSALEGAQPQALVEQDVEQRAELAEPAPEQQAEVRQVEVVQEEEQQEQAQQKEQQEEQRQEQSQEQRQEQQQEQQQEQPQIQAQVMHEVHMHPFRGSTSASSEQGLLEVMRWVGRFFEEVSMTSMVKALCVLSNLVTQLSPLPQVLRWRRRGHTGHADAAVFICMAFGGWQWCFYGLYAWTVTGISGFLVLLKANLFGALFGTWYACTFMRKCQDAARKGKARRYIVFCIALILFEVMAMVTQSAEQTLLFSGIVSAGSGFMSAASALEALPAVLRARDARAIHMPTAAASVFCSCCWVACGLLLDDLLIAAPNAACFVAYGAALVLKWVYPSSEDVEPALSPRQQLEQALVKMGASLAKLEESGEGCKGDGPIVFADPLIKRDLGKVREIMMTTPTASRDISPVASEADICCDTGGTC